MSGMQIFVKTLRGKKITLDVAASNTIEEVKYKVLYKTRLLVHLDHQSLVHTDKQLEDCSTLSINGIEDGSTLFLVMKPWWK